MLFRTIAIAVVVSAAALAQPEVVATGLQSPQKIIVTPGGNLLVAETSLQTNSGRLSIVTSAGARRTLIEGLPSGTDVVNGPSGPTAVALQGRTLYIAIGGGDTERRGEGGRPMYNPQGVSSPIFCSVLAVRLSADIDMANGPMRMTREHQSALADGGEVTLTDATGTSAAISVLARIPTSEPDADTVYRFSNPWGLALSESGTTLFMTDASANALIQIDTATGRWQRIVRFPPVQNVTPVGPPMIDIVPTSVRIYGPQVLVSFLTGFPFTPGNARVLAVNPTARTTEPFIFGINSAVDVLWRPTSGARPQFYVLEFSQNQGAQPAAPGRLLRYDTTSPVVVAGDLTAPTSMAMDSNNSLYVVELTGRLLRFRLN